MKRINRHNYEAFLLDYSEGVLPAEEVAELLLFVETNADLEIDLSDFDLPYLTSSIEIFNKKEALKEIPRIEELVIGYTEKVLNEDEIVELASLEKNNASVTTFKKAYEGTILPLEKITFPNKNKLKRTRIVPMYWVGALAAAIFIGMIVMLDFGTKEKGNYATGTVIERVDKVQLEPFPVTNDLVENIVDTVQIEKVRKQLSYTPIEDKSLAVQKDPKVKIIELDTIVKKTDIIVPDKLEVIPLDIVQIKKDSVKDIPFEHKKDAENDVAMVSSPNADPLTVKEFLKVKTKEIILKDKSPTNESINGNDILASFAEGVNSKTKMEVAYLNEESESKKVTKFKLGKIEFYKSSSK
jgi:hypothetical protein